MAFLICTWITILDYRPLGYGNLEQPSYGMSSRTLTLGGGRAGSISCLSALFLVACQDLVYYQILQEQEQESSRDSCSDEEPLCRCIISSLTRDLTSPTLTSFSALYTLAGNCLKTQGGAWGCSKMAQPVTSGQEFKADPQNKQNNPSSKL